MRDELSGKIDETMGYVHEMRRCVNDVHEMRRCVNEAIQSM